MKKLRLRKMIVSTLIVASVLALNPSGVSAEWKKDSNGWWNAEGNSYSTGWRLIDRNWYYFYSNGYMAYNTTIDGYTLNTDGAWSLTQESEPTTASGRPLHRVPTSTSFDAETQKNISENN